MLLPRVSHLKNDHGVDRVKAFLAISEIQISKISPTMLDSFNAFLTM